MGMKRVVLLLFAVYLLLPLCPPPGRPAELVIDPENDASMAVSVPAGANDGVSPTSFLARKKEWQNLVSDRKALDVEARAPSAEGARRRRPRSSPVGNLPAA